MFFRERNSVWLTLFSNHSADSVLMVDGIVFQLSFPSLLWVTSWVISSSIIITCHSLLQLSLRSHFPRWSCCSFYNVLFYLFLQYCAVPPVLLFPIWCPVNAVSYKMWCSHCSTVPCMRCFRAVSRILCCSLYIVLFVLLLLYCTVPAVPVAYCIHWNSCRSLLHTVLFLLFLYTLSCSSCSLHSVLAKYWPVPVPSPSLPFHDMHPLCIFSLDGELRDVRSPCFCSTLTC